MRGQCVYVLSCINTVCVRREGGKRECSTGECAPAIFPIWHSWSFVGSQAHREVSVNWDDQIVWLNRSDVGTHILSLVSKQSLEQAADPRGRQKDSSVKRKHLVRRKIHEGHVELTSNQLASLNKILTEHFTFDLKKATYNVFPDLSHYFPDWWQQTKK